MSPEIGKTIGNQQSRKFPVCGHDTQRSQQQSNMYERVFGCPLHQLLQAAQEIDTRLSPFDQDAQHVLSMFLKLCMESISGHTIFGSKPLSESYLCSEHCLTRGEYERWISPQELQAWHRLAIPARLSSSDLILRESSFYLKSQAAKALMIYSIPNVKEVYARHSGRFREKLGQDTTADTLIGLLHNTRDFNSLFNGDDELKGIIIGYGQRSSSAFARLLELSRQADIDPPFNVESIKQQMTNGTLLESFPRNEYLQLIEDTTLCEDRSSPLRNRVLFRVHKDDNESLILREKYDETSKALTALCVEQGEQTLARIALARWCGLLP
jgi:hypothetical protein